VFVANPNNPTGTWAPAAAVKRLLENSPPSTLVVLDEAYFEYGRARDTQDGVAWLAEHPNLVVLRTFSKAYGLAGARVGYAISHPEVAEVLNRLRPAFNVNSIAQAGALAALADQAHMRQAVDRTMSELTRVEAEFKRLGLWTAPSAANFLLLRLNGPAAPVFEQLLRRGLIVRPLAGYGLANCLRISIGRREENDRLLAALPLALAAVAAAATVAAPAL
jgi:histidinol-phosphate aminotransferase